MAGNQTGFSFSGDRDVEHLFTFVTQRLDEYLENYNLTSDVIIYIQLSFRLKDKKLLSEFSLDNNKPSHISKLDHTNLLKNKSLTIPISINEDSLGKPLVLSVKDGFITSIPLTIDGISSNFLDIIKNKAKLLRTNHVDNITSFYSNFKFYLLKDKYDYVLAVKILSSTSIEKIRYTLNGIIVSHVTDKVVDDHILRSSSDKEVIYDNKVVSVKQNIKLKPLEKPDVKPLFV